MKVSEIGEFGLIELLADIVDKSKNPQNASWQQLLIGIGDDAAAWQGDSSIQLATTDSLVQDIHFHLNITSWEELGWKAIAANLSDIAAMGGIPKYALVSLALPGELEVEYVSSLYQGMAQIANHFGIAIVGGDVVAASKVMITITVLGGLEDKSALTRSAAMPGDQVAVTGYLGVSAAGLRMLKQKLDFDVETTRLLKQAHLQPVPKVKEGQILLHQGVRAAIDISDGLIADLAQICKASQVSTIIKENSVPIHPVVQANFKADCRQLALAGGEDYELLFTATSQVIARVKQAISRPVTVIGEITAGMPGQVTVMDAVGESIPWQQGGWEHFKSQA
ncbi:MAG TPA: thiamine-phosphate kinase [Dehalococcoidia bacterium]|nr:thiamine-phosphate kinase [Dehalococcoidia bacterium]